jgi:hypothetical protein
MIAVDEQSWCIADYLSEVAFQREERRVAARELAQDAAEKI